VRRTHRLELIEQGQRVSGSREEQHCASREKDKRCRLGVTTCRTPTRARCPQLHQHWMCRRTSIGLSIRRRARSCRPQSANAVGERARMHRGRGSLAARTIDVRCLRSSSVSYHQGCIGRYRLDRRARTLKRPCDPHYLIGDVVDPRLLLFPAQSPSASLSWVLDLDQSFTLPDR